jgi:hypothetical protein
MVGAHVPYLLGNFITDLLFLHCSVNLSFVSVYGMVSFTFSHFTWDSHVVNYCFHQTDSQFLYHHYHLNKPPHPIIHTGHKAEKIRYSSTTSLLHFPLAQKGSENIVNVCLHMCKKAVLHT